MNTIQFNDFSKSYNKFIAVDNINFSISPASITGFVGKNGAGKSSTLRTMVNLLFPTKGSITINNLDSVKDVNKLKKVVSYIPSDVEFYENIRVLDLFKLSSNNINNSFEQAIELSKYFELNINKKVNELSLGNRKKVSIVLGFMKNSSIYILDEPTNGLDPLMQEKFFKKLLEKKEEGCTIFLSSHNLSEIEKYCDRAIIIKDGKIIKDIDIKSEINNSGILVSYESDKKYSYKFTGDINALLKELSHLNLKSLEIRPITIEETFINFYKGDNNEDN